MLAKLNHFIVNCSHSWWKFLLLAVGQGATMAALLNITQRFPALTDGYEPFDMQNGLTPPEIYLQLASYTPEAFQQYYIFQAVDYFFPLFGGLVLATVAAFGLRQSWYSAYNWAVRKNLLPVLLLPTVFDWLENINLLWIVSSWPDQSPTIAMLAVAAKTGKLLSMNCVFAIVAVLLIWTVINSVINRSRRKDTLRKSIN